MRTTGPNNASTNTVLGTDTITWNNPGNIYADDGVFAKTSAGFTSATTGRTLVARGYGFNLPSNATIVGIAVVVGRKAASS